ncbi:beta strand repeat-containing protein, partial [Rhodopirellula bahusiensis]|uniref:beta strand repeat-containing protein n=2 Tax=Rhodopirellula bahusiensis TaxID=2014065 RepID=UPI003296C003
MSIRPSHHNFAGNSSNTSTARMHKMRERFNRWEHKANERKTMFIERQKARIERYRNAFRGSWISKIGLGILAIWNFITNPPFVVSIEKRPSVPFTAMLPFGVNFKKNGKRKKKSKRGTPRFAKSCGTRLSAEALEARQLLAVISGGESSSWSTSSSGGAVVIDASLPGQTDAFDDAARVQVNGSFVGGAESVSGQFVNYGNSTAGGLQSSLEYYFSPIEATQRTLLTIENVGASSATANVVYQTNFGSDGGTVIQSTSSGDSTVTTADDWIVSSDSGPFDPVNTTVIAGPGAPDPIAVTETVFSAAGTEGIGATYAPLVLAPGEVRRFMWFQNMDATIGQGVSDASDFSVPLSGDLLNGISAAELSSIVNWSFYSSPTIELQNAVSSVAENNVQTKVADIVVDAGGSATTDLSLSGADAAKFTIVGSELFLNAGQDFEAGQPLSVTVNVDGDDAGTAPDDFVSLSVGIDDVAEVIQIPPSAFAAAAATSVAGNGHVTVLKIANQIHVQDELGNDLVVPHSADNVNGINATGRDNADDLLTVDVDNLGSSGDDGLISYEGGGGTGSDTLEFVGALPVTTVTHRFDNESDGQVDVDGNVVVDYSGLEPVFDNLSAVSRIFTFTGGAESISAGASPAPGFSHRIDSTLGESVDFNLPSGSLQINASDATDVLVVDAPAFMVPVVDINVDNVVLNADIVSAGLIGTAKLITVNGPNANLTNAVDIADTVATVDVFGTPLNGVIANASAKDITVRPGGTTVASAAMGQLSLNAGDHYAVEINGTSVTSDLTTVVNGVDVTGATLDVTAIGSLPVDGVYTIVDNQSATPVTGEFAGLAEGDTVTVGGQDLVITYVGGDGNDIVLFTKGMVEVEFELASSSDGEVSSPSNTRPTILVRGDLTGIPAQYRGLDFSLTAGTATPGSANDFTLDLDPTDPDFIIPKGDYSATIGEFDLTEVDSQGRVSGDPGFTDPVLEIFQDNLIEGEEGLSFNFTNGLGDALRVENINGDSGQRSGTTHIIQDDDRIRISVVPNPGTVEEGTPVNGDIVVETSSDGGVTFDNTAVIAPNASVQFTIQDATGSSTAVAPGDYSFADDTILLDDTHDFVTNGAQVLPFSLTTNDDSLIEGPETVDLEIVQVMSQVDPGALSLTGRLNSQIDTVDGSVTITDNEFAEWNLTQATSPVVEGGSVDYTFSLVGDGVGGAPYLFQAGETASVEVQVADITTTYGVDYDNAVTAIQSAVATWNATNGPTAGFLTATFAGGSNPVVLTYLAGDDGAGGGNATAMTPLVVNVTATDDSLIEGPETVDITLDNPGSTTGADVRLLGDDGTGAVVGDITITTEITDNEFAEWNLTQATSPVVEGGSVDYTFSLVGDGVGGAPYLFQAGETASVEVQ